MLLRSVQASLGTREASRELRECWRREDWDGWTAAAARV